MNATTELHQIANHMLLATSRTFYIPIRRLPEGLQEAVKSAYLCLRAIDEIEDDPYLPSETKAYLLRSISHLLSDPTVQREEISSEIKPYAEVLQQVTLRLPDWLDLCPQHLTADIQVATAKMAAGMATWVDAQWKIETEADLNHYTYTVAGAVGVLLSDLWFYEAHVETNKDDAIAFGRGLQAVNMIRNREDDLQRGIDFFPVDWETEHMIHYARKNLVLGELYAQSLPVGPVREFCKIPLALAHATLQAVESGEKKLSRSKVHKIVNHIL